MPLLQVLDDLRIRYGLAHLQRLDELDLPLAARRRSSGEVNFTSRSRSSCRSRNVDEMKTRTTRSSAAGWRVPAA
ncbi:hypothetical protein [Accumulibacter sp.]|uniref:hypothetical protein n=1 Tax=Accumulibacter sp. TaxID=2053492 RepID=UPI0035AFC3B4